MKKYAFISVVLIILLFQAFINFSSDSNKALNANKELISQIQQGGDPSLLLKATAIGSAVCDTDSYLYGTSLNGFRFVQEKENSLYAVDTGQGAMLLMQNETGNLFFKLDQDEEPGEIKRVLSRCENSSISPIPTDLHFVMLQN